MKIRPVHFQRFAMDRQCGSRSIQSFIPRRFERPRLRNFALLFSLFSLSLFLCVYVCVNDPFRIDLDEHSGLFIRYPRAFNGGFSFSRGSLSPPSPFPLKGFRPGFALPSNPRKNPVATLVLKENPRVSLQFLSSHQSVRETRLLPLRVQIVRRIEDLEYSMYPDYCQVASEISARDIARKHSGDEYPKKNIRKRRARRGTSEKLSRWVQELYKAAASLEISKIDRDREEARRGTSRWRNFAFRISRAVTYETTNPAIRKCGFNSHRRCSSAEPLDLSRASPFSHRPATLCRVRVRCFRPIQRNLPETQARPRDCAGRGNPFSATFAPVIAQTLHRRPFRCKRTCCVAYRSRPSGRVDGLRGMKKKIYTRIHTRTRHDILFPLERGRKVARCVPDAGRCRLRCRRNRLETLTYER